MVILNLISHAVSLLQPAIWLHWCDEVTVSLCAFVLLLFELFCLIASCLVLCSEICSSVLLLCFPLDGFAFERIQ